MISARREKFEKKFGRVGVLNLYLEDVLPDNSWKRKPCFIVGGGPSLSGFDFRKLRGERTIGINLAFRDFCPMIAFSMDRRFFLWVRSHKYGKDVTDRFIDFPNYRVWLNTKPSVYSYPELIYTVPVYESYSAGHWAFPFSMSDGLGHGNNSGYAALNLAVCLGANPIYLLGFDMKHSENEDGSKKTHYHDGHPKEQQTREVESYPQYFERIAPILLKKRVRVINLNPDSALSCFPKQTAEEVL